jgi:hypothetical protein
VQAINHGKVACGEHGPVETGQPITPQRGRLVLFSWRKQEQFLGERPKLHIKCDKNINTIRVANFLNTVNFFYNYRRSEKLI